MQVLERAGGVCENALCTRAAVHIHHLSYRNLGAEPLVDLLALCLPCHALEHPRMAKNKNKAKARTLRCPHCKKVAKKAYSLVSHMGDAHPHIDFGWPNRNGDKLPVWEAKAKAHYGSFMEKNYPWVAG